MVSPTDRRSAEPATAPVLSPRSAAEVDALAASFRSAEPFRHLVVDGFFSDAFAAELVATFPPFERGDARNEAGRIGRKAVVERVRELGPAWRRLDDTLQSHAFLDLIGRITGISDLLYDPDYVGGGTHENRHGQDLDPHVDFNRHPRTRWHRRLNLIVYLNPEWDAAWGGNLELHSDPRSPDDRVRHVVPLLNRAVLFETNEISWHGFARIELPAAERHRSRRSVALYLYTRQRPPAETAPTHSTIYVERPLPERLQPGYVLGQRDVDELREQLQRRDQHTERLYHEIAGLRAHVEELDTALDRGAIGRLRWFAKGLLRRLRR